MRPILAVLCAVTILGGLKAYMGARPAPQVFQPKSKVQATGVFDLEVLLTFDAGPDPFAFDANEAAALSVAFLGEPILRRVDAVPAGKAILVKDVQGIAAGANEFFVEAFPQDTDSIIARALRVRVFRNGEPIGDETIWSEPGAPVVGTVVVDTPRFATDEKHADGSPGESSVSESSSK